ncbi:MAG: alanine-zipper protein [Rhodospirillales bacterium]|nr:alanine-zipper protein [Rhodospirillales bacterium]MDH3790117.1 alanine-zipper protein [Rhodospirillales bacterium]MDH3918727.1 alanine-zipper protein [Rhodospirillales bacterium]MDH3968508.1 alanine-zipper protein [Rhodospirillales bacterium]
MSRRHASIVLVGAFLVAQIFLLRPGAAQTATVDPALLQQLQDVIQKQQQQLERQSEVLESLQQQVNDLKRTASEAQTEASEAKSTAQQAVDTAKQAVPGAEKLVTSGQERIKLAISGQVNRAVNVAGDGDKTKAYFVDSDASNTRFRLVGTGKVTDDFTIGTRFEVALTTNESSQVSQDNEDAGEFSDLRWADLSFDSKRFGKLSLGKGSTASDNAAEVDLSKTDVVAYSSVADIAGGLQFRDNNDNLTDVSVSDAFKNLDGLSRKDRLRYDTPTFYGFSLAGSAISDQRWDTSVWWGGQGYGLKAAAAAAISDANVDNQDLLYDGSFSVLHEVTGLNFTVSGGVRDQDGDDPSNVYAKAGWIANLFSFGDTAFGADYTRSTNFPTGSDDGYSIGLAAVQQIDDFGTELYAQYRLYSLDRDGNPSVEDLNVGTVGARVKF